MHFQKELHSWVYLQQKGVLVSTKGMSNMFLATLFIIVKNWGEPKVQIQIIFPKWLYQFTPPLAVDKKLSPCILPST